MQRFENFMELLVVLYTYEKFPQSLDANPVLTHNLKVLEGGFQGPKGLEDYYEQPIGIQNTRLV
ncbi:MAG: hypothetical protein BroJett018_43070 [Chloroflexota bacterium]|nr:MAG: hypothetical protein BroJett018_43070 [Chloroflexota bacterium]